MAKSYSIADARENFSEVVDRAASGTPVHISRRGKPVAVVVGAEWFDAQGRTSVPFDEAYRAWREKYDVDTLDLDDVFEGVRDPLPGRDAPW